VLVPLVRDAQALREMIAAVRSGLLVVVLLFVAQRKVQRRARQARRCECALRRGPALPRRSASRRGTWQETITLSPLCAGRRCVVVVVAMGSSGSVVATDPVARLVASVEGGLRISETNPDYRGRPI
jgi:hypothetical protein